MIRVFSTLELSAVGWAQSTASSNELDKFAIAWAEFLLRHHDSHEKMFSAQKGNKSLGSSVGQGLALARKRFVSV